MYACFTVCDYMTSEADAVRELNDNLIPMLKEAPGYVKGAWFGNDKTGHGLVLFTTKEQAEQVAPKVGDVVGGVKIVTSDVYEVHAEA
jgi:hypothetical protein